MRNAFLSIVLFSFACSPGTAADTYSCQAKEQLLLNDNGLVRAKPQMAEGFTLSDDRRTYTIRLREGLKFHDGEPVRARDCIASLNRWSKRDPFGQKLIEAVGEIQARDVGNAVKETGAVRDDVRDAANHLNADVAIRDQVRDK